MRFTELEKLKEHLKKEARLPSLNPVRFINIETMADWRQIKSFLNTLAEKTITLSSFCEETDTPPNLNRLKNAIRTSHTNTLVIPLSEYLRINNAVAEKTYYDILKANFEENHDGKLRIYIPLYRMRDILNKIRTDPREALCITYFDSSYDPDYSLTIIQDELNLSLAGNQTRGYQEYLTYWEQNPEKPVIFHTKNAINYKDIVYADNVTVLITAYDLLRFHYHLPKEIEEKFGNEIQWKRLSEAMDGINDIENAICHILSVNHFSESIFENWPSYDSIKKWMLWIWVKYRQANGYLGIITKKSNNVDEFVENCHKEIINHLDSSDYDNLARQRRELLQYTRIIPLNDFLDSVTMLEPIEQMKCMTDLTQKEKQVILRALSQCTTSESALKVLKANYPDAYYYLGKIDFNDQELTEYFYTYNHLKLVNQKTDEFLELVNKLAKDNNALMWHLPSRNLVVDEIYTDGSIILFVDALGVEYHSLLMHLFDGNKYDVESNAARCNLPSTTKVNTDFLEGRKYIRFQKLDELKHSSTIKNPDNLIEEFNLLHEVKEKADELLRDNTTVIITADHGSSRMAVLYRDQAPVYQSKENAQLEKYGRCCIDAQNDYSEIEGIFHDHDYWIFANYARFAERGAPQCEIHGGASFEEMIVPVVQIRLRKTGESTTITERISVITTNIHVGLTKEALVRFKLTNQYPSVKATAKGQTYTCNYLNGEYNFKFLVRSSGEVKVKIFSEDTKIGEFEINIIKGISKTDFDI